MKLGKHIAKIVNIPIVAYIIGLFTGYAIGFSK